MTTITLNIQSNGKHLSDLNVRPGDSVFSLKKCFHQKYPHAYPERQRFYVKLDDKRIVLSDKEKLSKYGLEEGSTVYYKDLGPQISWKNVFLLEYAGPLVIYLLCYLRPGILYSPSNEPPSFVVNIAAVCWTFHYSKRIFETLFVHVFSHATMPMGNLFKNCSYYWGCALVIGYTVNHPLYTPPISYAQIYAAVIAFFAFELGNLYCHVILKRLRRGGSTVRKIPRGFLFEWITCPNYTTELLAWLSFAVMTQSLPAFLFFAIGTAQMTIWAKGKHTRYLKEFPGKYPKRYIIFPFIY